MKSITEYLDDLKEKTGSDYASAALLGCDRSVISNIRKRGAIAEENAIKIADALGVDRAELLIATAIARSHGPVREAWEKISQKKGMIASLVIVFQTFNTLTSKIGDVFCILC
ncbi:hypothetical protein [Methylomonas sp. HYX-M1]|uniref:hypothetical protein n=1 Tax=Methylomonas sp. HYX-M1 TaxID=3139307 RepID=UPI00345C3AB3